MSRISSNDNEVGDAPTRFDPASSRRLERWENEGGLVVGVGHPVPLGQYGMGDIDALAAQVDIMDGILSRDLAAGRVGTRYNCYAHRARVLRQQRAKLDLLRSCATAASAPTASQ